MRVSCFLLTWVAACESFSRLGRLDQSHHGRTFITRKAYLDNNNNNNKYTEKIPDYLRDLEKLGRAGRKRLGVNLGYLDFLQDSRRPVNVTAGTGSRMRRAPPRKNQKRRSFYMRRVERKQGSDRNGTRTAWTILVDQEHAEDADFSRVDDSINPDTDLDDYDIVDDDGSDSYDDDDPTPEIDPSELRRAFFRRASKKNPHKSSSSSGAFSIENTVDFNFSCIGGYGSIKDELRQVTDFMQYPEKYSAYNVRLPRGVLLHGDPGTGKTLFAKCLAGECNLSFIPTSGSEFQEKYVGVGASRIRELFQYARDNKPCIIFIDEIDGVARRRQGDNENAQAERDTTLNQLLVEMDGFKENVGVMVLASTNREDILDPAVLRPGRIDKQVHIALPNYETRLHIAKIHLRDKPISADASVVAAITAGCTGAQIENLLNEVSLYGIRENIIPVNVTLLEKFHETQMIGKASRPLNFSMTSLWRIAVHEMGHVLLAFHADHHEKPLKCTIASPNGRMAGYTTFGRDWQSRGGGETHVSNDNNNDNNYNHRNGDDDNMLLTKEYLMDRLRIFLGGRVAEEIIFGTSISSGARHDLDMCFELAKSMVIDFGMGKQVVYPHLSDHSRRLIDEEITHKIETAYNEAKSILQKNKNLLHYMSKILLTERTLDRSQLTFHIYEFANQSNGAAPSTP